MKNSIILGIALIASLNVVNTANAKSSVNNKLIPTAISEYNTADFNNGSGFVSFADPTLIATELGSLKKASLSIDETIAADNQIIESTIPAKTAVLKLEKRKAKVGTVKLRRKLVN